jgi:serine/threonine-protein kinase RsbW
MAERLTIAARGRGPGDTAVCSRSYPGQADQVPQVRAFLARILDGCPAADDAVLMADELAANAVIHSHSGEPGGMFTVRVEVCDGISVRVGVQDEGGPTPPRLRTGGNGISSDEGGEGGQGLRIVSALSDAWGVTGDVIARTVWFRLGWGAR